MRGRALRRRCFALSPQRCIMPAMGAYAGGLNLRDAAFRPLFRGGLSAHMLGDGRLFRIDERLLIEEIHWRLKTSLAGCVGTGLVASGRRFGTTPASAIALATPDASRPIDPAAVAQW
jgi:hypothetical protein